MSIIDHCITDMVYGNGGDLRQDPGITSKSMVMVRSFVETCKLAQDRKAWKATVVQL